MHQSNMVCSTFEQITLRSHANTQPHDKRRCLRLVRFEENTYLYR